MILNSLCSIKQDLKPKILHSQVLYVKKNLQPNQVRNNEAEPEPSVRPSVRHWLTDQLPHLLCAAPVRPFIQNPTSLLPPSPPTPNPQQPTAPPKSPGGSTCLGLSRSPANSSHRSPWLTPSEAAPHGPPRGRRQHGPLQLHPHGLDPHGAGHQDRQGYGRFGIPPSSS